MHGSVDWCWVTGDSTGATIYREPVRRPPGLAPFITPPAASHRAKLSVIDGHDAVARYVTLLEADASRRLLARLRSAPTMDLDAPLGFRGLLGCGRIVDEVRAGPDGSVLVLAEAPSHLATMRRADADPTSTPPGRTMGDLLRAQTRSDATITALLADGTVLTVVGHEAREDGGIVRVHLLETSAGPGQIGPAPSQE
jgi:hypothetical protein